MDRYEEALERAKAGKPIDEVFPELKESEDERIRKELVEYFSHTGCNFIRGIPIGRVRDYLEKQKEKKPSTDETELNSIAFLERLGYTCIPPEKEEYEVFEDGNATGLMRKEQKPADIPSSGSGAWGTTPPAYKLDVKPAEWSEEDENKIESIKGLITTGRFADTNTIRTIWKLLDSLRPQPHWKPSEEQMQALKHAYSMINGQAGTDLANLYYDLKKL